MTRAQVAAIHAHAEATFPEECCGFLVGPATEPRTVASVRRAKNMALADRERRYVIDPMEQLAVDHELRGTGQEVLGFYHSHPNHPAEPSEFDRSRAWPWYSYVILSILDRKPADLRAWRLDDESSVFQPEPLNLA